MSEIMLHSKLRELEEELKIEREIRTKYEKELSNLKLDLADMEVQLQEANMVRDREIEASKRLRQEIADLKQKIDHQHSDNEESIFLFKRKQQEQFNELSAHIESLSKSKFKFEKENKGYLLQIDELRKENDSLIRAKTTAQGTIRDLENKQIESVQRIDELVRQLNEFNDLKAKLNKENSEYFRRNSSLEFEVQQLSLANKRLNQEHDDARLQLENEQMVRNSLDNKIRTLQEDLDKATSQLEEEAEARLELQKHLAKVQDELKSNKEKVERECQHRIDEVEDSKRRLNNRYLEVQEQLTEAWSKFSNLEKAKLKLQTQFDSLSDDYEKTKKRAEDATKHEKALEKEAEELRYKLNEANVELESLYTSNKNYSIEVSKYRHLNETLTEQLDIVQKERRKLSDEVESTNTQLLEHQGKLNDIERKIKAIELDRQTLQNELDDARDLLQIETSKSQSLSAQYEKLKTDTDRKIVDKENENESLRSSTKRQLESMQSQLEDAEQRAKNDLSSLKKRFQADMDDMRERLESAKKAKIDAENQQKKLMQTNKELIDKLTEEQNSHDLTCDQLISTEKKTSAIKAELEEIKSLYERAEKSKKALDLEFHDLEEKLNEMQAAYNKVLTEKKKFEADAIAATDELYEAKYELKNAEEKVKNLNSTLLKREEELKQEKEINHELENSRKSLEQQLKDIQTRVEDAEDFAKRETKRISNKFEARVVQLENELEFEKAKEQEIIKELRRLEKRNKDLADQVVEEQNKFLALSDAYDKQQEKMKKYKGQIEGAEEQIAANISKCKKLQRELEDAEDRAQTLTKNFLRASSVNRNIENANVGNSDSDYGDSDSYSSPNEACNGQQSSSSAPISKSPYFLRASSYLYPRSNDDYSHSKSATWRSNSNANRFTTKGVDIDDDDILVTPRHSSRYSSSSFAYQAIRTGKPWSVYNSSSTSRNERARSVAHMYESENTLSSSSYNPNQPRYGLNTRSSVSRFYDDEPQQQQWPSPTKTALHRLNAIRSYDAKQQERLSSIYKTLNKTNGMDNDDHVTTKTDLDTNHGVTLITSSEDDKKSVEIEKGILLAPETSVTPTPENLD